MLIKLTHLNINQYLEKQTFFCTTNLINGGQNNLNKKCVVPAYIPDTFIKTLHGIRQRKCKYFHFLHRSCRQNVYYI
jgi:hypothetical protein